MSEKLVITAKVDKAAYDDLIRLDKAVETFDSRYVGKIPGIDTHTPFDDMRKVIRAVTRAMFSAGITSVEPHRENDPVIEKDY